MKITKDIWILLTEYDELNQIEIIFYKNSSTLVKPYLYFTNKNNARLLKMDENDFVFFSKIDIEKNSEFKFAIIGEQEVIKYEIFLGNNSEECYLISKEKCESEINSNNYKYKNISANSIKNQFLDIVPEKNIISNLNTENIENDIVQNNNNQDSVITNISNTNNDTQDFIATDKSILSDDIQDSIDTDESILSDNNQDSAVIDESILSIDIQDSIVTDGSISNDEIQETAENNKKSIEFNSSESTTVINNIAETDITKNDEKYNTKAIQDINTVLENLIKDFTMPIDIRNNEFNNYETEMNFINIDNETDFNDSKTNEVVETFDMIDSVEDDKVEKSPKTSNNLENSINDILDIEDTNELNIENIFNIANNDNSNYNNQNYYIDNDKEKIDSTSKIFNNVSIENILNSINIEESLIESSVDENKIENVKDNLTYENLENSIDNNIENKLLNNIDNSSIIIDTDNDIDVNINIDADINANIDSNINTDIDVNIEADIDSNYSLLDKKEFEGKHCKKTVSDNNNISFQGIIDTIDNFDFSLNNIKDTKKQSSQNNIFEHFINESINKTYFKPEPIYKTNIQFENILKNSIYNSDTKNFTNNTTIDNTNNEQNNDEKYLCEWSIVDDIKDNSVQLEKNTNTSKTTNIKPDTDTDTLLYTATLSNEYPTINEQNINESISLDNDSNNKENTSLIISNDKKLKSRKRHGLSFSYKMNKKIKIALIKIYRTLPNFLKGDYRRRINL